MDHSPLGSSVGGDSPGKNPEMGCMPFSRGSSPGRSRIQGCMPFSRGSSPGDPGSNLLQGIQDLTFSRGSSPGRSKIQGCMPFSRGSSPGRSRIEPKSPALQEDSLLLSHWGSPNWRYPNIKQKV